MSGIILNKYKKRDTLQDIYISGIKEDCIITPTHLVGIIEVDGIDIYSQETNISISDMTKLFQIIDMANIPVQLLVKNQRKNFQEHLETVNIECKKNDYDITIKNETDYELKQKFYTEISDGLIDEKDLWKKSSLFEFFTMKYKNELHKGIMTLDDIKSKIEESNGEVSFSALDSYNQYTNKILKDLNIKEKRFYIAVSSLETHPHSIDQKVIQQYDLKDFSIQNTYTKEKKILEQHIEKIENYIRGLFPNCRRKKGDELLNIINTYFNPEEARNHTINSEYIDYPEEQPRLENSYLNIPFIEGQDINIPLHQKIVGGFSNIISSVYEGIASPYTKAGVQSTPELQLIKPSFIDDSNKGYLKLNRIHTFTVTLTDFGFQNFEDLLLWDDFLTSEEEYDLSIHIIPWNKEVVYKKADKKKSEEAIDYEKSILGKNSYEKQYIKAQAEEKISGFENIKNELQYNKNNIFSVSIDITFKIKDIHRKEEIIEKLKGSLGGKNIQFCVSEYTALWGFLSTCPFMVNLTSGYKRPYNRIPLYRTGLSHLFPFAPRNNPIDKGLLLGVSMQSNGSNHIKDLVLYDFMDRQKKDNSNTVIFGRTGSGKTVFSQITKRIQSLLGYDFISFDFLGNYEKWGIDMNKRTQVIFLAETSIHHINPCDIEIPSNSILEIKKPFSGKNEKEIIEDILIEKKIDELMVIFRVLFHNDFNESTKSILDDVMRKVYMKKLKNINIYSQKSINDVFIQDFVNLLKESSDRDYNLVGKTLQMYATKFNKKTNIKIDENKNIVFSLSGLKDKTIPTLLAFYFTEKIILNTSRPTIAYIDELSKIFKDIENPYVAKQLGQGIVTWRNYEAGVVGATQEPEQIQNTEEGGTFIRQSDTKLFLGNKDIQKMTESELSKSILGKFVSNSGIQFIKSKGKGYAVFIENGREKHIQIIADEHFTMFKRYSVKNKDS